MGFLKKVFGSKELVVDPADLSLPDVIPTDKPGLSVRKASGTKPVPIEIVGESFRPKNVAAVAAAASGNSFDIYLVPEPTNQYDKRAVAVFAANLHIGYIAKPANKQWFKWVNEALEREEVLWGTAKAVSRQGTANTGIFGSIYMPASGREAESLIAQRMTDSSLKKSVEKVIALANASQEPDTIAQLKSLAKKAVAVATPFAAHAKWVLENSEGQDLETWDKIMSACEEVFDSASDAAYAVDADDVDIIGGIESLVESVTDLRNES